MAEGIRIVRRSLRDKVAAHLRSAPVEGCIASDAKLSERELCELAEDFTHSDTGLELMRDGVTRK